MKIHHVLPAPTYICSRQTCKVSTMPNEALRRKRGFRIEGAATENSQLLLNTTWLRVIRSFQNPGTAAQNSTCIRFVSPHMQHKPVLAVWNNKTMHCQCNTPSDVGSPVWSCPLMRHEWTNPHSVTESVTAIKRCVMEREDRSVTNNSDLLYNKFHVEECLVGAHGMQSGPNVTLTYTWILWVWGLRFGTSKVTFRVWVQHCGVWSLFFRVWGLCLGVLDLRFGV